MLIAAPGRHRGALLSFSRMIFVFIAAVMVVLTASACLFTSKASKRYQEGVKLYQAGLYTEAISELEAALEMKPNVSPTLRDELAAAHVEVGKQALAAGSTETAQEQFRRALELVPNQPAARLGLGEMNLRLGNGAQAREFLALAASSGPADVRTRAEERLADAYYLEGDYAGAVEQLQKILKAQPQNARARVTMGRIFLDKGEIAEALGELQQAVTADDSSGDAHYYYGAALLRDGHPTTAAKHVERAMYLKNAFMDDAKCRALLGDAYLADKVFPRAAKEYERAVGITPAIEEQIARNYGIAAYHVGDNSLARKYLDKAMEGAGNDPVLAYYLGALAYREGRKDVAARYVDQAFAGKVEDSIADLSRLKGLLLLDSGHETEADSFFEKYVSAGGTDPAALYRVGRKLAARGSYDDAVELLTQAVTQQPANADARFSLGLVYEKLREYNRAAEQYNEIVTLSPDHGGAHLQLGILYAKPLANRQLAIQHWEQYLALRPSDPQSAAVRANLGILKAQQQSQDEEEKKKPPRTRRRQGS
ncbi:MAG: tetratricopeptide repeat protein [Candidatus Schekmanbacteria bacterium]|nr:tetratricopeptide repeat protein [Candidatus Schekmanbacteria bacterium]